MLTFAKIGTNDLYLSIQMIIAGYMLAIYQNSQEQQRQNTPGNTPVRRRGNTQTQASQPHEADNTTTPATVEYAQTLISGELSQRLFA